MDIRDICSTGGDILDTVADAVSRNDYSGLSSNIRNSIDCLIDQVKEEAANRNENLILNRDKNKDRNKDKTSSRKLPAVMTARPAGRISGPVQLAWGILAASGFGSTAVIMAVMLLSSGGTEFAVSSAVFGTLTAWGITDIVRGIRKIGLVSRFRRYAALIGERSYIAVEELAFQTAQDRKHVLRDLKKMMKKHMFLQGRLDQKETTLILTTEAYQQYLCAEEERRDRERQEMEQEDLASKNAKTEPSGGEWTQEAQRILKEGNAYIRMVHECNEKIRSEQMSYKLSSLEAIMRRIFEHVEQHPDSAEDLHKFMDYYLPTTTKLLNAYIDLDRQQIAGENILAAKREIENALDVINDAFEKLLDGLFEDTAWDIASDISVMKMMMAQEGLTGEKDFTSKKTIGGQSSGR